MQVKVRIAVKIVQYGFTCALAVICEVLYGRNLGDRLLLLAETWR